MGVGCVTPSSCQQASALIFSKEKLILWEIFFFFQLMCIQAAFLYEFSVFLVLIQVSEELIRVAILWHEMWHEGLEEASRLYFGERNVKGMFEVLEPLHAMMERGPQTLKETSFNQVFGSSSRVCFS